MVLYVFVVAYVGGVEEAVGGEGAIGRIGPLFAAALLVELCIAIIGSALPALDSRGAHVPAGFGSPGQVGKLLLEKFLIPFEAASFLLLVAAVGAVVLARRRRGLHDVPDDELPERAGRAPVGDPAGRADIGGPEADEPPPGTAEGKADPTAERDAEPAAEPEGEPVTEPA